MRTSIGTRFASALLAVSLPLAQTSSVTAAQFPFPFPRPSKKTSPKRDAKPTPAPPAQSGQDARSLREALDQRCLQHRDLTLSQKECYDLTLRAVEAGDTKAMAELGWRWLVRDTGSESFHFKVRVAGNNEVAFSWIARSAKEGSRDGMTYLGWMYQRGIGVNGDLAQAQTWLRRGAEAGSPRAMALLGALNLSGEAPDGSEADGERWLRRAVDAGDRRAMTHLALLLFKRGTTTAPPAAGEAPLALLNRACAGQDDWKATTTVGNAGDPLACYHLGVLYTTGSAGVAESRDRAGVAFANVEWLARNSDPFSRDWYEVGNGLTADVRRAAEQGRREFAPHLTGFQKTDSLWTTLVAFTAILAAASIVGAALAIEPADPHQTNDGERDARRRRFAERETACIMMGGTWMSLSGVCVF